MLSVDQIRAEFRIALDATKRKRCQPSQTIDDDCAAKFINRGPEIYVLLGEIDRLTTNNKSYEKIAIETAEKNGRLQADNERLREAMGKAYGLAHEDSSECRRILFKALNDSTTNGEKP